MTVDILDETTVEILDETGRFRRREPLRRALERLGAELGARGREMTLVLVDDDAMAVLNETHRDEPGPTDVLAFPLHDPADVGVPQVPLLGDVIVSLETATRQAREHARAPWREVAVLAAHGLVHLLGHDHLDAVGWRPFEKAQERVLKLLDAPAQEAPAVAAASDGSGRAS